MTNRKNHENHGIQAVIENAIVVGNLEPGWPRLSMASGRGRADTNARLFVRAALRVSRAVTRLTVYRPLRVVPHWFGTNMFMKNPACSFEDNTDIGKERSE